MLLGNGSVITFPRQTIEELLEGRVCGLLYPPIVAR
jgi:hypothetical protein